MPDLAHLYLVHCGSTGVVLDELRHEAVARVLAHDHEAVHGCGAWVQVPLEPDPDDVHR